MSSETSTASKMQVSDEVAIQITDMNKWYGTFHVLKDVNLTVNRGERIVVCGPSGSGKSTLIRCINRLEEHLERMKASAAALEFEFDRHAARGMRLDIAAGTAVRFEPGQRREVNLIPLGGARRVFGFNQAIMGDL